MGDDAALVVDTRATLPEADELLADLRRLTTAPVRFVVNTHAHFDHCFGNARFPSAQLWAQQRCITRLTRAGEVERRAGVAVAPELAADLAAVPIVAPRHAVAEHAVLDVGGRAVRLAFLGRGHTDHDLVVVVADAGVTFAGDLVEEGAPPDFADAHPVQWPATLRRLAGVAAGPVVPGHGDVVDRGFVVGQADAIAAAVDAARAAFADRLPPSDAAAGIDLPGDTALTLVQRVYAELRAPGA